MPLAALSLIAAASPATASVTIGQLAPAPTPGCASVTDRGPASTVTSGNSYVVPAAGTITSWSTNAADGAGQTLAMKVFRKVADPATYTVVGHDGPRNLAAGALNTFPVSIAVKPGDFLGLNGASPVQSACFFAAPAGNGYLSRGTSNLQDGQSAVFPNQSTGFRLNISAVLSPSNSFTLGTVKRNKKKGTASLTVKVPNPGGVTLFGKGLKSASATATAAGDVKLKIKATGKKKLKLNDSGKVKVTPNVTYTPTGGDPNLQFEKLKLKKNI